MSNIKNKINFFENLLDKNKSQSLKNTIATNNTNNNVKKKITHWNKIRKKVLTESDINYNDSSNKNKYIITNTITNITTNNTTNYNNDDDDETLFNENSIIN